MSEAKILRRWREDRRRGKSPSTQAGEFVREEVRHVRKRKHGARSAKQAIAIGLSKARRAGVKLQPPRKGRTSTRTRRQAGRDLSRRRRRTRAVSTRRSRATLRALRREGHRAASRRALSRHSRMSARQRGKSSRTAAARKAVRTRSGRYSTN